MCRRIFSAVFFAAASFTAPEGQALDEAETSGGTRWYRSNASGMSLELISSERAALRNEYCLSVERRPFREAPEILRPFYDASYRAELRRLYEKGAERRRQWIFRDGEDRVRLTASGSGGLFEGNYGAVPSGEPPDEKSGFIEIRDSGGSVVREFRFEDDASEWDFRFFYAEKTLVRLETWFAEPPPPLPPAEENSVEETAAEKPAAFLLSTDYYRYSRSGALRAVDRIFNGGNKTRLAFTGSGAPPAREPIQGIALSAGILPDARIPEAAKVSYSFDSWGRVVTETYTGEDGAVLGEFTNTWSDGRLQSISWKSRDDERLVEYEYDTNGERVAERNFRRGALERQVSSRNGRDTEEIYMNGKLVLRALWENGRKIAEERIVPPGGGSR